MTRVFGPLLSSLPLPFWAFLLLSREKRLGEGRGNNPAHSFSAIQLMFSPVY